MDLVASLSIPLAETIRSLATALAPLSEASGVSTASEGEDSHLCVYWFFPEEFSYGVIQIRAPSFGPPTDKGDAASTRKPDCQAYQGKVSRNRGIHCYEPLRSVRLAGTLTRRLQWRLPWGTMRHNLMMTLPQSVRASAIKLSEERLRQARNRGLPAKGDRYSLQSLLKRGGSKRSIVCNNTGKLKVGIKSRILDILDMVFHPWIPGKGRDRDRKAYG
jgi:hypothetical protein